MQTVHLVIKGKVQGVFFRASTKEKAKESGIKGWVKNMPDGNVEVLAAGNKDQLENFIEWCRRGPKQAIVSDVIVSNAEEIFLNDFRIIK
jgi:acylphosphatase